MQKYKGQFLKGLVIVVVIAITGLILPNCSFKENKVGAGEFSSEVATLFSEKCFKCHAGGNVNGGFGFADSPSQMLAADIISTGYPENTLLYKKLAGTHSDGERMPKGGPYLTDEELAYVKSWILTYVPPVAITTPSATNGVNSATATVSGTCSVPGATITLTLNSVAFGTTGTCTDEAFSISSVGTFNLGNNTLVANINGSGVNTNSATVTVYRSPLVITSPSNSSTSNRLKTAKDTSFIDDATNSASYAFAGTCEGAGATVSITIDGAAAGSATCDGSNFSGTFNSTVLSDGTHKMVATSTYNSVTVTDTVYIFKYTGTQTYTFSTDILPLFTIPRSGNLRACIDCHYNKASAATGSASFSFGYWASCTSGGKPVGTGGSCTSPTSDPSSSSVYTTCNDPNGSGGSCITERQNFVFQFGYYKYTSTTAASNEGQYADTTSTSVTGGVSIVNDKSDVTNGVANRIVRGNPNQSFIYKKLAGGTITCNHTFGTIGTAGCRTSQGSTGGSQMPVYNATYIPNYFSAAELEKIQTWITQGARTDN